MSSFSRWRALAIPKVQDRFQYALHQPHGRVLPGDAMQISMPPDPTKISILHSRYLLFSKYHFAAAYSNDREIHEKNQTTSRGMSSADIA